MSHTMFIASEAVRNLKISRNRVIVLRGKKWEGNILQNLKTTH